MHRSFKYLLIGCLLIALGIGYWRLAIPKHRVGIQSELVMLGDLDGDHRWGQTDLAMLNELLPAPFAASDELIWRLDLNQNSFIDEEDLTILRTLVETNSDPYAAFSRSQAQGQIFPRPRELYRYLSLAQYHQRPLWSLPYSLAQTSSISWVLFSQQSSTKRNYQTALTAELYDEAVRFDQAYRRRQSSLLPIERDYAQLKLARAKQLFDAGEQYELLLALIALVEDAETLTARGHPEITLQILKFRDHLREVLASPIYAEFSAQKKSWRDVLKIVAEHLQKDFGLNYDFENMPPARNFTHLENYLQRAEWQIYKSSAREEDFLALINYAQHDRRYLRSVARTSRKLADPNVENHNLPMSLLFRQALRIKSGDKKKAVGLLDEAIRVPYAWIKMIPREMLSGSLAYENFLLPGNKEDGADKSRHWNVFGGICLYKSPLEALDLALKREMQDLREEKYSPQGMREFFRDMIANLNGMYNVLTINPELV